MTLRINSQRGMLTTTTTTTTMLVFNRPYQLSRLICCPFVVCRLWRMYCG